MGTRQYGLPAVRGWDHAMHIEGNRILANGTLQTVHVRLQDGKIVEIKTFAKTEDSLPLIVPGFIDIHVHGGGGADTMDHTIEAYETIAKTHARYGTTSMLLTTVTESDAQITQVLHQAKHYMTMRHEGAQVIGVHLEGPFIHPDRAGAQRLDCIVDPQSEMASRWFDTGIVKMITMAPERPHAHDVARLARAAGIIVAAGHTRAKAVDVALAKLSGFSHVTHLCNAMEPLLHREGGPIGHVIEDQEYTADLICDGIHVHSAMIKALVRSIGSERLMLITDAIRATAMGDGLYDLGGQTVKVQGGQCQLEDGTLAGSVLTMGQAFSLVQSYGLVHLADAQRMTSENAARKLGLHSKGKIELGYDADLVLLTSQGDIMQTVIGGE
ncbi:N-acetylglucosamine-6-phosphate deacetylase [Acidibacillus sp. S0AB]|uniref:N-acetylglucosamine-6-phosphate deacetylase n=2 Tax=Sulfoacidibacillus ferrooxidans TaxID=2005001 RepID=A0A9X2AC72_9BACL|nr:N-acetylglucosamine-6-phosphate deacetylase [Sulfoacidibacillus ferrooxidans]